MNFSFEGILREGKGKFEHFFFPPFLGRKIVESSATFQPCKSKRNETEMGLKIKKIIERSIQATSKMAVWSMFYFSIFSFLWLEFSHDRNEYYAINPPPTPGRS